MLDLESISRAIDPAAWDDARWATDRGSVETMHKRRQAANEAARRVQALLPPAAAPAAAE